VRTVRANGLRDGYIRVVITRGVGDLGLDPRKCARPTMFIIADTIRLHPESVRQEGLAVVTVGTRRMATEAINPAVKSLNYLNNILAKIEATVAGADEALLLNQDGYVAECTGENVFVVTGSSLVTPPVSAGALDGITRGAVMEIGRRLGMDVREANLTRYDLFTADECFLTGTAAELIPVVKIDGRVIGSGRPGPVMKRLSQEYHALTQVSGEPIRRK
jgi:branched-chain amino acid aminotransferase